MGMFKVIIGVTSLIAALVILGIIAIKGIDLTEGQKLITYIYEYTISVVLIVGGIKLLK